MQGHHMGALYVMTFMGQVSLLGLHSSSQHWLCLCRKCVRCAAQDPRTQCLHHHDAHAPAGGLLPLQRTPVLHVSLLPKPP